MTNWMTHFLVPHRGNHHRPHVLRAPAIRTFLTVVIFIEALFLLRTFGVLPDVKNFAAVLSSAMVLETNVDRAEQNLTELKVNPLLEEAARQKAADMAAKGYFSHIGPEGEQPWKWLRGVGYYYLSAGENLAINFTDSRDVTDAWMNSPAHRANMLSGNFTEIGIGTAEGMYKGKETTFVVQFFGKPYEKSVEVAEAVVPPPAPKATTVPKKPILAIKTPTTSAQLLVTQPPAPERPLSTVTPVAPEASSTVVLGAETRVLQGDVVKAEPTMLGFMMTNPRKTTMFAVLFFAVLVVIGLVLTLFFRKKTQHRDLITNALAFLAIILCMLVVNDYFTTKDILLS